MASDHDRQLKHVVSLRFAPDVFEKVRAALPQVQWDGLQWDVPFMKGALTIGIDDEMPAGTWCEVYADGTRGELWPY